MIIKQYTCNKQLIIMLSRAISPHISLKRFDQKNLKAANRSKSTASFSKARSNLKNCQKIFENKFKIQRIESSVNYSKIRNSAQSNTLSIVTKNVKGKLHLGKLAKPNLILPVQVRNNPWCDKYQLNEQIIKNKGLFTVINMGMIPKDANLAEILNNKYELQQDSKPQLQQQNPLTIFATDPKILGSNPGNEGTTEINMLLQHRTTLQIGQNKQSVKKKVKRNVKKATGKNFKKQQEFRFLFQPVKNELKLSCQKVIKDSSYQEEHKKSLQEGYAPQFYQYMQKVEDFAKRYNLKKFSFIVEINPIRKTSDSVILRNIMNYKVLGIELVMAGGKRKKAEQLGRTWLYRFRYNKIKKDLLKIQSIKRYMRINYFFKAMTLKRINFLKFKLGSFVENQRRFIQSFEQSQQLQHLKKPLNNRLELHIPLIGTKDLQTQERYYKLKQRNNIQLTRIFNTQPQHLIVFTNEEIDISPWLKILQKIPGYHPLIKVFDLSIGRFSQEVKCYNEIYYGLGNRHMSQLKKICKNHQQGAIITSSFQLSVIKISEMLNLRVLCGSLLEENIKVLNQEESQPSQPSKNSQRYNDNKQYYRKLVKFQIINQYFNNKINTKKFLLGCQISTPFCLFYEADYGLAGVKRKQFLIELTKRIIITNKQVNIWVFKLGECRFSRGIALLETNTLKILKQKKKKQAIDETQLNQIAQIMKFILQDKLSIPQKYLLQRQQYLKIFFEQGGYVQAYIPGCQSRCIFGQLLPNGFYSHFGTYSKLYTDQLVNCAAVYPAFDITEELLEQIQNLCRKLFHQYHLYGRITFQFVYCAAVDKFHIIDIVPSIEQYSSLKYFYDKCFDLQIDKLNIIKSYNKSRQIQLKQSKNRINKDKRKQINKDFKRNIIYCPFIDNNGNKYANFKDFQDEVENKKWNMNYETLQGVQFFYLNLQQKCPDALSLVTFSNSQRGCCKHFLDALNFLIESGDKVSTFDKKVERKKYDCIYINDIIWKLRQIKKKMDNQSIEGMENHLNKC